MTKTVKVMTFRQRLRLQSEERLESIKIAIRARAKDACEDAETEINPADVMRLLSSNRNKSLHDKLITELTNEAECELEKLYNRQSDLTFGTKQGDEDGK